jgi:hypothetical protein
MAGMLGRRPGLKAALAAAAIAGAAGAAAQAHAAGPITSRYYAQGQYAETYGVGITFTGTPFATGQIDQINEYSDPDPHAGNSDPNFPSANVLFGADYTSMITAAMDGTYTFTETSDDPGYLFVDGALVAATPGNHLPSTGTGTVFLTAGAHSFEYQMSNAGGPCCAEADVGLPTGVAYSMSAAPEPGTWALMLSGVALAGLALRRRTAALRLA